MDHLNPGLKHTVHYGRETGRKGSLDWFSMFCFERNNKRIKSMVKNTSAPVVSLVNNILSDIKTRIDVFNDKDYQAMMADPHPKPGERAPSSSHCLEALVAEYRIHKSNDSKSQI